MSTVLLQGNEIILEKGTDVGFLKLILLEMEKYEAQTYKLASDLLLEKFSKMLLAIRKSWYYQRENDIY